MAPELQCHPGGGLKDSSQEQCSQWAGHQVTHSVWKEEWPEVRIWTTLGEWRMAWLLGHAPGRRNTGNEGQGALGRRCVGGPNGSRREG